MAELVEDLDVRHQPMAADDPWEVKNGISS
jgi:hypothetical protein